MADIKFPSEVPSLSPVTNDTVLLTSKDGLINKVTVADVVAKTAEIVQVDGGAIPAIQGGATPETAVALPNLGEGTNKYFDASSGYWKYNNVVLTNPNGVQGIPDGSEGVLFWNGTTQEWSISKVQELITSIYYVGSNSTLSEALNSVPPPKRDIGIMVVFLNTATGLIETWQFVGTDIAGYGSVGNWKEIGRTGEIYNLKGSYTLENAIAAIPNQERKQSAIITFNDSGDSNKPKIYQYKFTSIGNWILPTSWVQIPNIDDIDGKINTNKIKNELKDFSVNEGTLYALYTDNTVGNTNGDFSIVLDLGFRKDVEQLTYIISKGAHAYTHSGFSVSVINRTITFKMRDSFVKYDFNLNDVNRYVFTKEVNTLRMYVNGNMVSEVTSTFTLDNTNAFSLRLFQYSYNNTGANFKGVIGIVGMTLQKLTDDQIFKIGSVNNIISVSQFPYELYISPEMYTLAVRSDAVNKLFRVYGTFAIPIQRNYVSSSGSNSGGAIEELNRVSELSEKFPIKANIAQWTFNRNSDENTNNPLYDYNVANVYNPKILSANIEDPIEVPVNILECDSKGWFYGYFQKTIRKSQDLTSWVDVITIPEINSNTSMLGFKLLNNGELLILDGPVKDDANLTNDKFGKWYVTTANKTAYQLVHTNSNRYMTNVISWGVEVLPDRVLVSEYGNSYNTSVVDPTWNKGTKADANRIWQSFDNGLTWSVLVYLHEKTELYPADGNLHIHAIHYDYHWKRLWVTTGDGAALAKSNRKIIWTDDFVNWSGLELTQYYWDQIIPGSGTPYDSLQGLSMYADKNCLLIGTDCWRNGLFRINKKDRNNQYLEDAYYSSSVVTDITHFTGRIKRFLGSPIFVPFARGDSATPVGMAERTAKLVATFDGLNFAEIWVDETVNVMAEFHFNVFFKNGEYYFTNRISTGGKMFIRKYSLNFY